MNTLSICKTVYPNGQVVRHLNNTMKKPEVHCMRAKMKKALANAWQKNKFVTDPQELVLNEAKRLIYK